MKEDKEIIIQRRNDGFFIDETDLMNNGIYLDGIKITTVEEWDKAIEEFKRRETEYIHKSKIKEKIEELEQENEETYTKFLESDKTDEYISTKGKMIQGAIQVLQELMEDK